ncbi:nas-39 [Trichonephila inaurata madagascariensis]|uniref:Nas-39 n=1 Tax=Trichonephila inaurata madagascariensis TaxID=2747483 RepID=A0A8X7CK61_9ARAC|nr:nas-39 [Trichonephila inaurata madagascariensis]
MNAGRCYVLLRNHVPDAEALLQMWNHKRSPHVQYRFPYIIADMESRTFPVCSVLFSSDGVGNVPFAGETVVMKFKSDNKNERPGFSILVQQQEDCEDIRRSASSVGDCSHEFSAETFLLQSPRFPEEYPADVSCEYRIRRASSAHCKLELRILSFDVEEGTDGRCEADCLELPAGFTLCGQLPKDHTESLLFSEDEIVLKFRSDAATQRPGFSIQARQTTNCGPTASVAVPEEEKCGGVYEGEEFLEKS